LVFPTIEKRIAESTKIREKFPDKIPIIVEKGNKTDIPEIDKNKFLVPNDLTVGQFSYVIRKRLQLSSETALFIVVNNILPPTSQTLAEVSFMKKKKKKKEEEESGKYSAIIY
jgi:GABA(A) receptor-associated protein